MKIDKMMLSIGIISFFLIILSLNVNPRYRKHSLKDKGISKKHKNENTIDIVPLSFISVTIPLTLFFRIFRSLELELDQEILSYVSFLSCQLFITAIVENLKNLCGRLRPDFLARCRPVENICTGFGKTIKDGRKSFPSGHSATSAGGFFYAVFFINSHTTNHSNTLISQNKIVKKFVTFIFILIPFIVGFTRYFDNRHHITDILAGLTIGLISSRIFYKYSEISLIDLEK
ncbi:phospholipid phosphatase [Vairimorpha necatrix]|uniref:Phospholipid phosphatase n=1 Tax=Vairimorpha necatrix TaxID=6039 RepID=A0AAX4JE10_9MICR